jgi:hypothetical protein
MNRTIGRRRLMRRAGLGLGVATAATAIAFAAQPGASAGVTAERSVGTATVNVVHGIPAVAVKVCVDGEPAIRGFQYGEKVTGSTLPAGTHRVRVVPAGKPCSAPALLKERYMLDPGKNYTIVAALRPSGSPALKAFRNQVGATDPGTARVTVRHTAQAPAVNVWAGGTKLIAGKEFSWGDARTLAVPAGSYRLKVTLPGDREPVIGPRQLTLRAGTAYQVHAVGDPGRYRLVVIPAHVGTSHQE